MIASELIDALLDMAEPDDAVIATTPHGSFTFRLSALSSIEGQGGITIHLEEIARA